MIHLLIYVNVTFTSYWVLCKGLMQWTSEQVTQFVIAVSCCASCQSHRESAPCRDDQVRSHKKSVARLFWILSGWKQSMGGGLLTFCVSLPCSPLHRVAAVAPGRQAGERREGGAVSGVTPAEHFPGMLAPSAQAENFASANCDFRTQVCSWTWTPSCQCVAICHQHMAP